MHPKLLRLAEIEVNRAMEKLPGPVREAAEECLVCYESMESALADGEPLEEDILGLFDGYDRMEALPGSPGEMPRIRLFLDNLWDFSEGEERVFRQEVRITYLHELGHYLGWGEEEIEALGLA